MLKKIAKPLYARKLKRRFQSAYDECDSKIDTLEVAIHKLYSCGEGLDLDINEIVQMRLKIEQARKIKELVSTEYKNMFDEDIS